MNDTNPNSRLEAFCDGVFAIALTLLVFNLRLPDIETSASSNSLWISLRQLLPSFFAFLLSFCIIFITWVNHHATLKLVSKTSSVFIYANGFMLLTVVLNPFTTALLGEYLFTNQAAPAVVLYTALNGLQAFSWILLTQAALKPVRLTSSEKATLVMQSNRRNGYVALVIYSLCTILAFWFPLAVALTTTVIWLGWLFIGMRMRLQEPTAT